MMRNSAPDRILLLARPPDAGRVGSRLAPPLPAAEAVKVYQACIHDTLQAAACERGRIEVWYEDAGSGGAYFDTWFPHLRRRSQATASMADRLIGAFDRAFRDGARRVIALPGDAPVLPSRSLSAAFDDLHEVDLVLGPTGRKGWYLIGVREIAWPSTRELVGRCREERTVSAGFLLRNAKAAGLRARLLPGGYRIERMEDLCRAREDAAADSNLGRWLASRTARRYVSR